MGSVGQQPFGIRCYLHGQRPSHFTLHGELDPGGLVKEKVFFEKYKVGYTKKKDYSKFRFRLDYLSLFRRKL